MKRDAWKLFLTKLTVLLTVGLILFPICSFDVSAQRRRGRVYNQFDHNVAAHSRQSCSECHKSPTGVSSAETASGENYRYPDITDYPDHDSCLDCHRQQFFRGARPAICSVCHTKVSPRDKARFEFKKSNQASEFAIRFPHDVHQDIIARQTAPSMREINVAAAHFVKAKFTAFAGFQDDKRTDYNNCSICHAPAAAKTYTTKPRKPQFTALETGLVVAPHREKFPNAEYLEAKKKRNPNYTVVGHFKTVPNGHDSCFNCHYSEQKPIRSDCAGCHIMIRGRIAESNVIERYSLKFSHEETSEGGSSLVHDKECAVCHVRITQSADLRSLKPDVPIFTCATGSCHGDKLKMEIGGRDDKEIKSCSYCHSEYIGSHQIPESHRAIK